MVSQIGSIGRSVLVFLGLCSCRPRFRGRCGKRRGHCQALVCHLPPSLARSDDGQFGRAELRVDRPAKVIFGKR